MYLLWARSIQPKFPDRISEITCRRMDRDFVPVSYHSSLETTFALIFKMADVGSLLFVLELLEDFEFTNDIMDDDDDIVVFSVVSCFMRRNLTRISGYFEQTVPSYLPDEFRQHFRMTRETCEILTREIIQTKERKVFLPWSD